MLSRWRLHHEKASQWTPTWKKDSLPSIKRFRSTHQNLLGILVAKTDIWCGFRSTKIYMRTKLAVLCLIAITKSFGRFFQLILPTCKEKQTVNQICGSIMPEPEANHCIHFNPSRAEAPGPTLCLKPSAEEWNSSWLVQKSVTHAWKYVVQNVSGSVHQAEVPTEAARGIRAQALCLSAGIYPQHVAFGKGSA